MNPRVVVTGMGVATPLGTGVPVFWDAVVAGRSGIAPIRAFDASALRSRIAGEVTDLEAERRLPAWSVKRTARFGQLALAAALEAVADARLPEGPVRDDIGVVVGAGAGGFEVLEREHEAFVTRGPGRFNPLTVPIVIVNMAAGAVAMATGCRGPNLCIATACASGAHALGSALDLLRSGRARAVLAGSTESTISPFAIDGYCQLRALSTRNDDPAGASRPFSADRDGFVIAEGAGMVVLETLEVARERGATIRGELVGYGASADAHHLTAPEPEGRGAVRAMRMALADAGLAPEAIDVVSAHGTSTPLNDIAETGAIKQVFGAHARRLAVPALKSMIGHTLAASASIAAVASLLMLRDSVIHPTLNLAHPDPACDLDHVPEGARRADLRHVMVNAFGFGGHNGVLVFRRFDGD